MVDGEPAEAALELVAIDDRAHRIRSSRFVNRKDAEVRRPLAGADGRRDSIFVAAAMAPGSGARYQAGTTLRAGIGGARRGPATPNSSPPNSAAPMVTATSSSAAPVCSRQ